jgi:hypothetical protein
MHTSATQNLSIVTLSSNRNTVGPCFGL